MASIPQIELRSVSDLLALNEHVIDCYVTRLANELRSFSGKSAFSFSYSFSLTLSSVSVLNVVGRVCSDGSVRIKEGSRVYVNGNRPFIVDGIDSLLADALEVRGFTVEVRRPIFSRLLKILRTLFRQ